MTNLCVIAARAGSKGVPSKNSRLFCGKPLFEWTLRQALRLHFVDHIYVSTDSQEILDIAAKYSIPHLELRPETLSGDSVGKWDVWQYCLNRFRQLNSDKVTTFIDLDVTCPLRIDSDILKAYDLFNNNNYDAVFSVTSARKNPYFNLVEYNSSGFLEISKPLPSRVLSRQAAPKVFEHLASFYFISPAYLMSASNLLDGYTVGSLVSDQSSIDIDTPLEFKLSEFLFSQNL